MRPILLCMALAGCMTQSMPEPYEGERLFALNCAGCHGVDARGAGPWAEGLDPPPADLRQMRAKGYDRARILSIIDGYDRADLPGQAMPEFGLVLGGPTVPLDVGDGRMTPVPRGLAALLAYLESIQEET